MSRSFFFVAVGAFQHCFLSLQSPCFGFGFGAAGAYFLALSAIFEQSKSVLFCFLIGG